MLKAVGITIYKLVIVALLIFSCHSLMANTFSEREYDTKISFMHHIIRYTQWLIHSEERHLKNFYFCSTNTLVFSRAKKFLENKSTHSRPFIVNLVKPSQEKHCQVLFISHEERLQWKQYLASQSLVNILLLGESPGFANNQGHLNFYIKNYKIRFEINLSNLQRSSLKMSSKLLRLANFIDNSRVYQWFIQYSVVWTSPIK